MGRAMAKKIGPALWSPGEGSKGQISFNFNLQSQFQILFYQTLCVFSQMKDTKHIRRYFHWGPQGFWGSGENGYIYIFRDLGSTGNYLRGAGEQAHSFGDLGSPAEKQKKKNKGKASILFDFLKFLLPLGG